MPPIQPQHTACGIKVVRAGGADTTGPVVGLHMVADGVGELIGRGTTDRRVGGIAVGRGALRPRPMLALAGTPLHAHG
ncbi:hypothetical protein ACFVKB_43075 [Rhodococcus sp. NPDC127530]|uniref:hypothetical protein n=1 Tax=unclassified Rhodococcus (in: high G+C Gram-positive bacteria) TaxID=192944 RepID=UPI003641DE30